MSQPGIWGFPEEASPCGQAGTLRLLSGYARTPDAPAHIQAIRVAHRPWFIVLWEKLTDKGAVPGPVYTKPYCCYVRTVIFYKEPYRTKPGEQSFERWAEVKSPLRTDDVVEFEGEQFVVGTGQVRWHDSSWWLCRAGWLINPRI